MAYITRLHHFKFAKESDELVVTSERDPSFEKRYDWPEGWSIDDEDLVPKIHAEHYVNIRSLFEE
jgi:hypothetical protein